MHSCFSQSLICKCNPQEYISISKNFEIFEALSIERVSQHLTSKQFEIWSTAYNKEIYNHDNITKFCYRQGMYAYSKAFIIKVANLLRSESNMIRFSCWLKETAQYRKDAMRRTYLNL